MSRDYQEIRDPVLTISNTGARIYAQEVEIANSFSSGNPEPDKAPPAPPDPFDGGLVLAYERALARYRATHKEPYGAECRGYPIPKEIDDICVAVTDARYFDETEQSVGRYIWDAWRVVADHLLVRSYCLACLRVGQDPMRVLRMGQPDKPVTFLYTMARRGGVLVLRPHGDRPLTIVQRPWPDDLPDFESAEHGLLASANSLYQMADDLEVDWPKEWDPVGLVEHLRETLTAKKRLRKTTDD